MFGLNFESCLCKLLPFEPYCWCRCWCCCTRGVLLGAGGSRSRAFEKRSKSLMTKNHYRQKIEITKLSKTIDTCCSQRSLESRGVIMGSRWEHKRLVASSIPPHTPTHNYLRPAKYHIFQHTVDVQPKPPLHRIPDTRYSNIDGTCMHALLQADVP